MKPIVRLMIYQWNMSDIDWLGYELKVNSKYTYHHIEKKEFGGKRTINNGAILIDTSHTYLHLIESKDLDMYIYLNNILKNINNQREMPNRQQLLAIDSLLTQFEKEHDRDRTKKGKILIKEEYTRRIQRRKQI